MFAGGTKLPLKNLAMTMMLGVQSRHLVDRVIFRIKKVGAEYFIQGHSNGKADGIALQAILDAFDKQESDHKNGFYRLYYDETNVCDFTVGLENEVVTNICVHRPCGHQRLSESIFDVLRIGPYVLFAPGGNSPIIAQPHMRAHLPDGMVEALGKPMLVHQAEDILTALFG